MPARGLFLILLLSVVTDASAQNNADPRAAMPERPTVATHAWAVAPHVVELETGVEWDRNKDASYAVSTPTLVKIGLAPRVQLGLQGTSNSSTGTSLGVGDAAILLK
jgi:hypothetical protein